MTSTSQYTTEIPSTPRLKFYLRPSRSSHYSSASQSTSPTHSMSATSPAQTSMFNFVSPAQQSSYKKEESNAVVDCLLSHSSDRSYKPDPIDESILKIILQAGQRAPTTCNGQNVSVILVKDRERIQRLAELAANQLWIAQCPVFLVVCGDFYKIGVGMQMANSSSPLITESLEGIMTACTDVGVAVQAMMLAARSFDLGCVPIGGIRAQVTDVCELLNLPPYVVPIVGLCIGHVEKHAPLKPRLDPSTFVHLETYNSDENHLREVIREYDQVMEEHWKKVNRPDGQKWSESMSSVYSQNYRPNLRAEMQKQRYVAN